jgi:Family of unknown function (DUF6636)
VAFSHYRGTTLVAVAILLSLVCPSISASASMTRSGYTEFQSPSKNIHCDIVVGGGANAARCDIGKHSFHAPPKPRSCHFEWGFSVAVRRHGHWACVNDPATGDPNPRVLAYGHSTRLGHIRCASRKSGMTCRNLNTGHGFKLSRAAVTFF